MNIHYHVNERSFSPNAPNAGQQAWLRLEVQSRHSGTAEQGPESRSAKRTAWHGRRIWIVRVRRALPGPGSPAAPRHDGVVVMRRLPHGSVAAREPEFA